MNVYFVVHGSAHIGMGHVMRSLSLAEAFRECGHQVVFFSKYEPGIARIRKSGFPVRIIPGFGEKKKVKGFFYGNPEEALQDAQYIQKQLSKAADIIIVDSYNVTPEFFRTLKKASRYLVYIDDLNAFSYPVDFLINGSAAAMDMGYEKTQSAQLLLGLSYNLIRKEFRDLPPRQSKEKITDILLTTGNSDPCHMTEMFRDIFASENIFRNINFHVIIGSGFEPGNLKDLNTWADLTVYFYEQPERVSMIMQKCDLAITAGGSTLYELAACGVPAIAFAYAENQIPQILALEKRELLYYIGIYQNIDKMKTLQYLKIMKENYDFRKVLTKKLQTLVDANGSIRIVKKLEQYCH